MPKRPIRQTLAEHPEALPGVPVGRPALSASVRRESAARDIEKTYGSVLKRLAKIAFETSDPAMQLRALATLAPYLYPALKGVELTSGDGLGVTVEIRKVGPLDAKSDAKSA